MAHDKKAEAGQIRFIVPIAEGRSRVIKDVPESAIRAALSTILPD